jgi:Icc-related predicted phosphoesterase
MRLLALADIHGKHDVYRRLPSLALERHADLVILAGDLLGMPDEHDTLEAAQASDAAKVLDLLEPLKVPLLYIMGNDDWVDLDPAGKRFRSIHRKRIDHGLNNFVGYQHTIRFMGGINEKTEEEIRSDLADIEPLLDTTTIFVTHSPAYGILDKGILGRHIGSPSLLKVIERSNVRIHIHGHSHCSFGRSGRHFNVAAAATMRGMLIDTDTREHDTIRESCIHTEPGSVVPTSSRER